MDGPVSSTRWRRYLLWGTGLLLVVALSVLPLLVQERLNPPGDGQDQQGADQKAKSAGGESESLEKGDGRKSPAVPGSGKLVPPDRVSLETEIVVGAGESVLGRAEEELRKGGELSVDDVLAPSGDSRQVGDSVFTRARQVYKDVTVFGAHLVMRVVDGRIVSIRGTTEQDIRLPSDEPENDYAGTIALASALLEAEIAPQGEGERVIVAVAEGHRIAWSGVVTIDGADPEQVVFDAADGAVLLRVPTMVD